MQFEWDLFKDNKTWKLIYPPHNRLVLKGRWVFKEKLGVNERVIRDKARWVDFLQREEIDCNEIVYYIEYLIDSTAAYDWDIDLINVVTTFVAFLYADIKE